MSNVTQKQTTSDIVLGVVKFIFIIVAACIAMNLLLDDCGSYEIDDDSYIMDARE